jgi:hypothetical protein
MGGDVEEANLGVHLPNERPRVKRELIARGNIAALQYSQYLKCTRTPTNGPSERAGDRPADRSGNQRSTLCRPPAPPQQQLPRFSAQFQIYMQLPPTHEHTEAATAEHAQMYFNSAN